MSGSQSEWMTHLVPVDPLLKEPLDLHGRAQRCYHVEALLRQLHLDHRMDRFDGPPFTESTYHLTFDMLPRIADVLSRSRVHVPSCAQSVAAGMGVLDMEPSLDRIATARALLDFGWAHLPVNGGEIRDVLGYMRTVYIDRMSSQILRMFRRWEASGWIHDVAA